MRQSDLARGKARAAADHGRIRDGVVRRSEWAPSDQTSYRDRAGNRGDDRRHPRFLVVERGQQSRNRSGQKSLARSGRADHQQTVTAGQRHLQAPSSLQLASYLRQVRRRVAVLRRLPHRRAMSVSVIGLEAHRVR